MTYFEGDLEVYFISFKCKNFLVTFYKWFLDYLQCEQETYFIQFQSFEFYWHLPHNNMVDIKNLSSMHLCSFWKYQLCAGQQEKLCILGYLWMLNPVCYSWCFLHPYWIFWGALLFVKGMLYFWRERFVKSSVIINIFVSLFYII